MKKLKNRLFVKKRKKYLKCEFQKTCTFEVTCWKMIHNFQVKNRRRFVILLIRFFFGTSKFHEKSWIFGIKISIVQKKVDEKTTFPKSPICDPTLILWIFEKNRFFFEIFCSNLHFKKKRFFWSFFFGIFLFKKVVFRNESKF